jgi:hypothetical protein
MQRLSGVADRHVDDVLNIAHLHDVFVERLHPDDVMTSTEGDEALLAEERRHYHDGVSLLVLHLHLRLRAVKVVATAGHRLPHRLADHDTTDVPPSDQASCTPHSPCTWERRSGIRGRTKAQSAPALNKTSMRRTTTNYPPS